MKKLINQRDAKGREHGVWEEYRSNGKLRWRGHYYHGERHGLCEEYWSNGTVQWRAHYHHDKRHGVGELYYPDGTVYWRGHHNMNRLVGLEQEWNERGELVKSVDHGGQVPMAEVETDLVLLMSDPAEMFAPIKQDF